MAQKVLFSGKCSSENVKGLGGTKPKWLFYGITAKTPFRTFIF